MDNTGGFVRNFRGLSNVKRMAEEGAIHMEDGQEGDEVVTKVEALIFNCSICNRPIKEGEDFLCPDCRTKVENERAKREAEEDLKIKQLIAKEVSKERYSAPILEQSRQGRVHRIIPLPVPGAGGGVPEAVMQEVAADVVDEQHRRAEEPTTVMCENCNCGFHRMILEAATGLITIVCAECFEEILTVQLPEEGA